MPTIKRNTLLHSKNLARLGKGKDNVLYVFNNGNDKENRSQKRN